MRVNLDGEDIGFLDLLSTNTGLKVYQNPIRQKRNKRKAETSRFLGKCSILPTCIEIFLTNAIPPVYT